MPSNVRLVSAKFGIRLTKVFLFRPNSGSFRPSPRWIRPKLFRFVQVVVSLLVSCGFVRWPLRKVWPYAPRLRRGRLWGRPAEGSTKAVGELTRSGTGRVRSQDRLLRDPKRTAPPHAVARLWH